MELKDNLAGKTPEEQTEWLRTHVHNWDEFLQGIVESEHQLAAWHAAGNKGCPPSWIKVEEYRQLRGLPAKAQ